MPETARLDITSFIADHSCTIRRISPLETRIYELENTVSRAAPISSTFCTFVVSENSFREVCFQCKKNVER